MLFVRSKLIFFTSIINKDVNTEINNRLVILFADPPNPFELKEVTLLPVENQILLIPAAKCTVNITLFIHVTGRHISDYSLYLGLVKHEFNTRSNTVMLFVFRRISTND